MANPIEAGLAYADNFLPEDDVLCAARRRGAEFGATPITPGGGAALRFLAAALGARSVVEIGTGCGVSGLWLLHGMRPGSTLTSVDIEPENQRLAREAFNEAGFSGGRVRLIGGRALEVLPRLTDGGYDLVFCDAARQEYTDYLPEMLRLLRVGGALAFNGALWHAHGGMGQRQEGWEEHGGVGQRQGGWEEHRGVADPTKRDPDTVATREVGRLIRDDERLLPVMLPVGDGLLVAVKQS